MDIDEQLVAGFAELRLDEATRAWIRYQWCAGLLRIKERQKVTKAESPNFSNLHIELQSVMTHGILAAGRKVKANPLTTSDAQLILEYVQHALRSDMLRYNVEPTIMLIKTDKEGYVMLSFKERAPVPISS